MSRSLRNILWISALFLIASTLCAQQVTTVVKYVSQDHVYLDAGSSQGIATGDQGQILRDGNTIARIEVEFVAEKSSSCKILERTADIQVGDAAVIQVITVAPSGQVNTEPEPQPAPTPMAQEPVSPKRESVNRLSGRIGFQYYQQIDNDHSNNDFQQPSLLLDLGVGNALGSQHDLTIRMRSRRNIRNGAVGSPAQTDWDNRIYEFSLSYGPPGSLFSYQLGRIHSNRFSGMGYIDGGMVSYRANEQIAVGVFGGTQPDRQFANVNPDELKGGIFASYDRGSFRSNRVSATLAFVGQYVNQNISREFAYQQITATVMRKLYLYQSAEININRGWRRDAAGSSLQLSNVLINLQYDITKSLNASIGYDNRQDVHTWENRSTPDSLFNDYRREGFRTGLNMRLPENLRLSLNGNLLSNGVTNSSSRFYSAALSTSDVLKTRIAAVVRVAAFDNPLNNGIQGSIGASKYFLNKLNLGASLGRSQYSIGVTNQDVVSDWAQLDASYLFAKRWYTSASAEIHRGDDINADRLFLDIGVRF